MEQKSTSLQSMYMTNQRSINMTTSSTWEGLDLMGQRNPGGSYQIKLFNKVYRPSAPVTELIFCDWFVDAAAGDAIEYHVGFLSLDRSTLLTGADRLEQKRVNALAYRVWKCCEAGLVHLYSQRINEGVYSYLAIRTPLTRPEVDQSKNGPVSLTKEIQAQQVEKAGFTQFPASANDSHFKGTI
jgi:hypothetical protein